jgi:hypothetical protein
MKNKRLIPFSLILILSSTVILSQNNEVRSDKIQRNIKDITNFNKAKASLYNGNWVFEATKIGGVKTVELKGSIRHFIVNKGDSCYLQLYAYIFTGIRPSGQNGYSYGKCRSSHNEITEDRKGKITKQMIVDGDNLHAKIFISLIGNGGYADVDISQISSNKTIKLHYLGTILPLQDSEYSYLLQ